MPDCSDHGDEGNLVEYTVVINGSNTFSLFSLSLSCCLIGPKQFLHGDLEVYNLQILCPYVPPPPPTYHVSTHPLPLNFLISSRFPLFLLPYPSSLTNFCIWPSQLCPITHRLNFTFYERLKYGNEVEDTILLLAFDPPAHRMIFSGSL